MDQAQIPARPKLPITVLSGFLGAEIAIPGKSPAAPQ